MTDLDWVIHGELQEQYIREMLDNIEAENDLRPKEQVGKKEYMEGFATAISRATAEEMIRVILSLYNSRASDMGTFYTFMWFYRAWGIDFDKSNIVWLNEK